MLLGNAQDGVITGFRQADQGKNDQRQHSISLADQELQPVDRRIPCGVERHDPVDRSGSQRQGIEHDPEAAEVLKSHLPITVIWFAVGIALQ